jgi:hypothetical protein
VSAQVGPVAERIDFDPDWYEAKLRELAETGQEHVIPIWRMLGQGVSILVLWPNGEPFEPMGGLSWVTIIRDHLPDGVRYDGFHLPSLGRLVEMADVWAVMVLPAKKAEAYESLAVCAEHGRNIVIMETVPEREHVWLYYLSAFAPDAGKLVVSPNVEGIWHESPTPRPMQ